MIQPGVYLFIIGFNFIIRCFDLFLFDSNLSEGWLENTICNCVWFVGVC